MFVKAGFLGMAKIPWLLSDPTTDANCSECNVLPICMGGCPNIRLYGNGDTCSIHKFMLKDYLDVIVDKIQSKSNKTRS